VRIAGRDVVDTQRVAGGDINDAQRVTLEDGTLVFVKTRDDAAPGEYATEAAALDWLREAGGLPVPGVIDIADDFLALEWLEPGGGYDEEDLGRGLAQVHAAGAERFGEVPQPPLRIGPLTLPDDPAPDWPTFYAEQRLLPLAEAFPTVQRVCERIHDLAGPEEPPARLHGDLWSGNVLASGGRPYLIDPAAYAGHREVDLAMLRLFGSPGPRFLAAYEEVAPLADGHERRVPLWQLFPLLVHAVLFGGSYGASAVRAARDAAG
jgi:fructosamine-3-kinase